MSGTIEQFLTLRGPLTSTSSGHTIATCGRPSPQPCIPALAVYDHSLAAGRNALEGEEFPLSGRSDSACPPLAVPSTASGGGSRPLVKCCDGGRCIIDGWQSHVRRTSATSLDESTLRQIQPSPRQRGSTSCEWPTFSFAHVRGPVSSITARVIILEEAPINRLLRGTFLSVFDTVRRTLRVYCVLPPAY